MESAKLSVEVSRYVGRTPKSKALQEEAAAYLPGGSSRGTQFFEPYPFFADHGDGHYVYDVDGNRYLDFMLNATTLILGHAHPDITAAVQDQAARGVSFSVPTDSQARLAKLICDRVPSIDSVRFTNSGTEATLYAIRAARVFTGRHKIAKFEGAYHGTHEYVSVSYSPSLDQLDPDGPTSIPEFAAMPPGVMEDVVVLPYNDLERTERAIRDNADDLACVIMEPVASSFGYLPGDPDFLKGVRSVTEELGILLVYDEVQSLRVAPGGAQGLFGITPDVTAMGKIVGGGMPAGAFGGRADVMSLFDPVDGAIAHAGTFNGNPMTMAAGEVTMSALTPDAYRRMSDLGDSLRGQAAGRLRRARRRRPGHRRRIPVRSPLHFRGRDRLPVRAARRPRHEAAALHRHAQRGSPAAGPRQRRAVHAHHRGRRRHADRGLPQRRPAHPVAGRRREPAVGNGGRQHDVHGTHVACAVGGSDSALAARKYGPAPRTQPPGNPQTMCDESDAAVSTYTSMGDTRCTRPSIEMSDHF